MRARPTLSFERPLGGWQLLVSALWLTAVVGCDEDPTPDAVTDTVAADIQQETSQPDGSAEVADDVADASSEVGPDTAEVAEDVLVEVDATEDVPGQEVTGPAQIRGNCPLDKTGGAFNVAASDTFGFVSGSVSNGVVPVTILEEVTVMGDCRLMRRNNPFCSPPCGPGTTCDFDGSCISFPEPQNLGDVTVSGLIPGTVTMTPVEPGNNYFDTTVPNPPFDDGAAIVMQTGADGVYGALTLYGIGFEPLDANTQWQVAPSTDFNVTWTAPATPRADVKVHLELNLDQHGNSPVILTCDFEDNGSATVPASLIDELLNSGVSGFPNGVLGRQTVDSVPVDDLCMEFQVTSTITPDVELEGHTPCNSTADCPDGQVCNVPINTCE